MRETESALQNEILKLTGKGFQNFLVEEIETKITGAVHGNTNKCKNE
jgi:hypothetical protein